MRAVISDCILAGEIEDCSSASIVWRKSSKKRPDMERLLSLFAGKERACAAPPVQAPKKARIAVAWDERFVLHMRKRWKRLRMPAPNL